MPDHRFRDRQEAGQHLGMGLFERYGNRSDTIVVALPRGGVPIGYEVAQILGAPLDVLRKSTSDSTGHRASPRGHDE